MRRRRIELHSDGSEYRPERGRGFTLHEIEQFATDVRNAGGGPLTPVDCVRMETNEVILRVEIEVP